MINVKEVPSDSKADIFGLQAVDDDLDDVKDPGVCKRVVGNR